MFDWFRRPELEMLLVGPPRSGTSMVSNLMSSPPETLILYEPRLDLRGLSKPVQHQLQDLGFPEPSSNRKLLRWAERSVGRWGIKEVAGPAIRWTYDKLRPHHVVFILRDLRHAAMSMYDRAQEVQGGIPLERRLKWMEDAVSALLDLYHRHPEAQRSVVRYEEAVTDPEILRALGQQLDWAMGGDLQVGFRGQNRRSELDRHGSQITRRSMDLRNTETDPDKLAFADRVAEACAEYQQLFGYSDAGGEGA